MQPEELEKLWRDPKSWRLGMIYFNAEDPRVIVPKRWWIWGGWTINFAHPQAGRTLLKAVFLAVSPILVSVYLFQTPAAVAGGVVMSVVLLVVWSHREANKYND